MKKKKIITLLSISVLCLIIYLVFIPRSIKRMEKIANNHLKSDLHWDDYGDLLEGPAIEEIGENYVSFFWYSKLAWGDTAAIYIRVGKSIYSSSLRDFIWPSTTMNYQWTYLELKLGNHRLGKFKDVLPKKNIVYPIDNYSIWNDHPIDFDSSILILEPDKLFFFLKEGYFEALKKDENYTEVTFLEPIGKMKIESSVKVDTNLTSGAKIYTNDSSQLLIIPYRIPMKLWQ